MLTVDKLWIRLARGAQIHRRIELRSRHGTMLLFILTLIMNLISIRFVRKYRQVYE